MQFWKLTLEKLDDAMSRNDVHWKSMETEIFSHDFFCDVIFSFLYFGRATERRQSRKQGGKSFFFSNLTSKKTGQ